MITVRTTLKPNVIVAGAMVAVSRISIPFQFQINEKNAIQEKESSLSTSPQDTWNDVMTSTDLLVQAVVCNRETIGYENSRKKNRNIHEILDICQSSALTSTPLSGEGIAKLIRYNSSSNIKNIRTDEAAGPSLPTSQTPNEAIIRSPVSLPLA